MARHLDMDFVGGNCVFEGEREGVLFCSPYAPEKASGNLWYSFLGRLSGEPGVAQVCLRWLPTAPHLVSDYARNQNFAAVLDGCMFFSADLCQWEAIEGVRVDDLEAHFTVLLRQAPVYIAVGMPYLPHQLERLLEELAYGGDAAILELGRTGQGRPISVVELEGGAEGTIYVQAYQHYSEWAGARIIERMIRHLASSAGAPYRQRFSWRFVPVVNMDAFYGGWNENPKMNLNRDWGIFSRAETRSVAEYLKRVQVGGQRLVYAADMHMGWSDRIVSGACLTAFPDTAAGVLPVQQVLRLCHHIFSRTNYTDRIWMMGEDVLKRATFSAWAAREYGIPAQTMEFSRFSIRHRHTGEWTRTTQALEENIGVELVEALAEFDWCRQPGD